MTGHSQAYTLYRYLTSYFSLAIHLWVGTMSTCGRNNNNLNTAIHPMSRIISVLLSESYIQKAKNSHEILNANHICFFCFLLCITRD